ncbi:FkbM family methyltransferase [Planktomarina temperata]|nr:FkbM family methyltransferase [Planktomarina temperata]MDC1094168.1 FkbM family methyltransferase [Planktomarina temperata]
MRYLKEHIRAILNAFGLDVKLRNNPTSKFSQLTGIINKTNASKLLDIGANIGQFSSEALVANNEIEIVCVEPIPSVNSQLSKKFKKNKRIDVLEPLAVCKEDGMVTLNLSKNLVSSSLLPMEILHKEKAPDSEVIERIIVEGVKLDTLFQKKLNKSNDDTNVQREWIIKIDAQGAEYDILLSAEQSVKYIAGFICELSLKELYSKQVLWLDFIEKMKSLDYVPFFIQTGFSDPETSETLQIDVGFIHNSFDENSLSSIK